MKHLFLLLPLLLRSYKSQIPFICSTPTVCEDKEFKVRVVGEISPTSYQEVCDIGENGRSLNA